MKTKILIFIFILCFSCFLKAQEYEYVSIVNEEYVWSYCDVWRVGFDQYDLNYFQLQIKGDTVIADINYKKVYYNNCLLNRVSYLGAIREEDKKVYVVRSNEQQEKLTYDFNLEVGDCMLIDDGCYYISKIDMVEIDGKLRKRFNNSIIEGIGILSGNFFVFPFDSVLLYEIGICFNYQKKGSEIVYKTNEFYFNANECDGSSIKDTKGENSIHVIFNQVENQCWINGLLPGESYLFELIDLNGKRLLTTSVDKYNNCVNVNNLTPGLSIYRLSEKTKTILSGTIIK